MRLALISGAAMLALPAYAQEATALPPVQISSDPTSGTTLDRSEIERSSARSSDTAETITRIPGVDAFGAGGVSSLPTIRGLDSGRVSILVDGVSIDEVCPNNMNPPLSYTHPQTVESVSVLTGVTPVSMGGDSIGGAISVNTADPQFAGPDGTLVTGRASAFYRSNGDDFGGAANVTVATDSISLTYDGSYTQSENHEGGGNAGIVRSSEYAKTDHSLTFGALTGLGLFTLRGGIQRAPYEGFPNQYMDMTDNRSWFLNGRYQGYFGWGDVDLAVHYRDTDHEMNFLDDKGGTASGGMPMLGEGHTAGYRLGVSLPVSSRGTIRLGSEFHHQWLTEWWPPVPGNMMMGPNSFININDANRDRLGSYAEWEAQWSDALSTTIGLRNDQLWMNTGDVAPYGTGMMQMADVAAAAAFNAADRERHDSNWSGSALLEWDAAKGFAFELGYAHKVRSPNLYERYAWGRGSMASRMIGWFGDGNGYVGNLNLDPERADTVSAAVTFSGAGDMPWSLRISPYYTHVADYIDVVKLAELTDMMGMPTGFVQLQFANREARFYGLDVSGAVELLRTDAGSRLTLDASASWLHGDNLADDDPLYHQMPFNASLGLHYAGDNGFDGHLELQAVADKNRVDLTRNEPPTDGYVLANIGAGYTVDGFRLGIDVSNLFDSEYALPLGGVSLGDFKATGTLRPVPGRGRSFNVSLSKSF
ncbi:TonB-dependent receptor [Sphingosinithalassobacter tenebrarum]|uniref:TonB-dependent receptor n=1 Tax=Stakelama tenebrarum TaxID=2711215 RepID=A0A6G6YAS6_9SPHN|nr:TonB-dependent receptor [Sphingosinithalassobacter tenebrarum]